MRETIKLLTTVVQQTKFGERRTGRSFTSVDLRNIRHNDRLSGNISAKLLDPKVPEHLLAEFTGQLRQLLSDYLEPETDRIGDGLVNLMGGIETPKIADFAKNLIRGAAILGPECVVKFLFGWIRGEPFHYKEKALLCGVNIDQPLALQEGIYVSNLPKSSADLPPHLPPLFMSSHGYQDLLGGVVLSIDCEAGPAFYPPSERELFLSNFKNTRANGKIPGLSIDTFCEALSLACNNHVHWKFSWGDFGDLEELSTLGGTGMSYIDAPTWGSRTPMSQEHLEQAREIHFARFSFGEKRRHLDTAVSRWIKSKRSNANLADKFIDLRIALEALYLEDDYEGEKRFRLATRGAWYLGADFIERHKYYKKLLKAYSCASRVVHTGEGRITEKEQNLLVAAQDICRKGILKRLKEKQKPKWDNIILGNGIN